MKTKYITRFFQHNIKTGNIPRQRLLFIFYAIPKTTITKDCNEYSNIFDNSFTWNVQNDTRASIKSSNKEKEVNLGLEMMWAPGKSYLRLIYYQKDIDVNVDIHFSYINFEKAFGNVKYEILQTSNWQNMNIKILKNLCV